MSADVMQAFTEFKEAHLTQIANLRGEISALNQKMLSQQMGGGNFGAKSLAELVRDSDDFQRFARSGRGKCAIRIDTPFWETKTTVTSAAVGSATSGVLVPERVPGVVPDARRRLYITDLLTRYPCSSNAVDYVKVNTRPDVASPQVEASDKAEAELTFTTVNTPVRTIAAWIPAAKQVVEDFDALSAAINSALAYDVLRELEEQILSGDNTGQNFNGITAQAQAFDTSLLTASDGWEYSDIVGMAVQQIHADDEVAPDTLVIHPNQMGVIRRAKATDNAYIFGPPSMPGPLTLWGLRVVETTAIASGTFAVGSTAPQVCALFERLGLTVEVSSEHSDFFVKNMVAIRCELRGAFVLFRPDAWVTGSFSQSPS